MPTNYIINGREICHAQKTENVKYCKYYRFEKCNKTGMPCASDKNCYYKLLQREIAKNEHLLKIADIRQETIINLARRKKELEQILAEIKKLINKVLSNAI